MLLSELLLSGFDRFNRGLSTSLAIMDKECETLQIVDIDKTADIHAEYRPCKVLSVMTRTSMPTRLRIQIDYLER